jgi:hypothetical protein
VVLPVVLPVVVLPVVVLPVVVLPVVVLPVVVLPVVVLPVVVLPVVVLPVVVLPVATGAQRGLAVRGDRVVAQRQRDRDQPPREADAPIAGRLVAPLERAGSR